ncbi:putative flavoprotein involved in K+ transport [Saccharopolyspora antimicrobica]|uniref:Flavoprotein involved in K+ transport n=1 Tax=Saccharopolyspora antimicrobica TaxID=455193 RepID=A0A1I5KA43_9PSEU|nr:NAD(P)-binding domain-containing protein [Saccharopolyspora antimicrobica]RKT81910.1 putative flavoprotein involved in K+ transport [Saccharopolyspora antimicrobica]SFO81613.1 putative flavoprotein involved in K+ transport [Saccharopolyspora antimicrobica]
MECEYAETVVIGAGQQGCGAAAALQELGRESIVLERGEIGQAWAHERWDSLLVGSGNRSVRFPGWDYDGDDPDGYMSGPELAGHLRRYAERRNLPIRQHTPVEKVECPPDASARDEVRFRTHLSAGGVIESRNAVAALGGYASPRVPDLAAEVDPSVNQLHSRYYRNPGSLPDGAVLVVGAGISGQQIADELVAAGREVFLSVGRHRTWPRHYRGRSVVEWLFALSLYEDFVTPDADGDRTLPGLPVTAVPDGGRELNLGALASRGVVLVGSARAAQHGVLLLEDNVVAIAAESARSFRRAIDAIDTRIRQRGFAVPEQRPAPEVDMTRIAGFGNKLDLARHGITTIIWCTGFGPDYRILPDTALDDRGFPIQRKGIFGALPGLYYAGLPDGRSQAPVAISANVENGRSIARQVHIDHILRSGSPASVALP